MRRVILESPFAGNAWRRWRNRCYARSALADCLKRGEAPFASHLLYTQRGVLRDKVPAEREKGMRAGAAWYQFADLVAVYIDRGVSGGMIEGIRAARAAGIAIEYRAFDWRAVSEDRELMRVLGALRQKDRRAFACGGEPPAAPQPLLGERLPDGTYAPIFQLSRPDARFDPHARLAGKSPREQGGSSA